MFADALARSLRLQFISSHDKARFIRVREKSGRNYFSQGQGKVTEFCNKSGIFSKILIKFQKGQGIFIEVREKWINSNYDSENL